MQKINSSRGKEESGGSIIMTASSMANTFFTSKIMWSNSENIQLLDFCREQALSTIVRARLREFIPTASSAYFVDS